MLPPRPREPQGRPQPCLPGRAPGAGVARWGAPNERRVPPAVCMAHPRRVARVAKQLEREVGMLLSQDPVLLTAVNPERQRGVDIALSALASVTEVELSRDMQLAKVYISVFSDREGQAAAAAGLAKLQGYVRTRVAHAMKLRVVPEIRLIPDTSLEKGQHVLALLDQAKRQQAGLPFERDVTGFVGFGSVGQPAGGSSAPADSAGPELRPAERQGEGREAEEEGETPPALDEGSSGNGNARNRRKPRASMESVAGGHMDAVAGGQSAGESGDEPTDEEGSEDEDSSEDEEDEDDSEAVIADFFGTGPSSSSGSSSYAQVPGDALEGLSASQQAAAELQAMVPFDEAFPVIRDHSLSQRQLARPRGGNKNKSNRRRARSKR